MSDQLEQSNLEQKGNVDTIWHQQSLSWTVVILAVLLGIWGCLAIYSTQIMALKDWGFFGRQIVFLLIGLPLLIMSWNIPFKLYEKHGWIVVLLALAGVVGVLFFGNRINGMAGWFEIVDGIGVQPSELAKPFFLLGLYIVWQWVSKVSDGVAIFALFCLGVAFAVPVAKEPDFGSAIIFIASLMIFVFLRGASLGRLFIGLLGCCLAVLPLVLLRWELVVRRFSAVFSANPDLADGGWHVQQFQLAIARGGLSGSKIGNSVWTDNYLPLAHNDSIFAAMSETLGILGTFPLLLMLVSMVFIMVKLSFTCKDSSRGAFVATVAFTIAFQALVHISVNATILPPSGLPLPLISYGGSSLISTMLMVGIALSACRSQEA